MDEKTRIVLENANAETRHIVIYNDPSLTLEDKKRIAQTVEACSRLESLTITSCPTALDAWHDFLVPVIRKHQALDRFIYTNNGASIDMAMQVVGKNKRIRMMDFSDAEKPTASKYAKLLELIATSDCLTNLTLPVDPYSMDAGNWGKDDCSLWVERCKNLISVNFTDPTYAAANHWQDSVVKNRVIAKNLLSKVRTKDLKTLDDIIAVNERLPAIIAVGTEEKSRSITLHALQDLNDFLIEKFGASIGLEFYITDTDAKGRSKQIVSVPAIPEPTSLPDLPAIQDVVQSLPLVKEEILRNQLAEGRVHPSLLMNLGQDVVMPVSMIALASLNAMTTPSTTDIPVRSMADFMDALAATKDIIRQHAEKRAGVESLDGKNIEQKPPVASKKKSLLGNVWGKLRGASEASSTGQADDLHSLADAGDKAQEAGRILQGMLPSLAAMEGDLTLKITNTQQIIGAYQHVSTQVKLIREVGHEVLEQWMPEDSAIIEAGTGLVGESSYHVQILQDRLTFMEEMSTQISGHISNHMLHAAVESKQRQGLSRLQSQNIPIIAEQVATLIRQVSTLQRAGIIDGLADATRESARSEGDIHVLAAIKTLEAIENLAGSTQAVLKEMGTSAEQMMQKMEKGEHAAPTFPLVTRQQEVQPSHDYV